MPEKQEAHSRRTILTRILQTKRSEVEVLRGRMPELRDRAMDRPPPRDFEGALRRGEEVALIAEVKRRSPGAGPIRPELDPADLASRYEAGGAGAISVLTDAPYFGGVLDDLARVRAATDLPVLRKDFVLDEAQVWEARAADADAVLLIARVLDDRRLGAFRALADELGMGALVEVHGAGELERALASGARILGVNNRDLRTFQTTLDVTFDLATAVPPDRVLVSESGIRAGDDVRRLGRAGVDAVLVGESLLRADDPGAAASELAGHRRVARGDV